MDDAAVTAITELIVAFNWISSQEPENHKESSFFCFPYFFPFVPERPIFVFMCGRQL